MIRRGWIVLTAGLVAAIALGAEPQADEPEGDPARNSPPAAAQPAPDEATVRQWIKDLDSDDFKVRDAATQKLIDAGRAVIAPVAEAAKGDSMEVATRAMTILKTLGQSEDAQTKDAARGALKGLAAEKDTEAGRQAGEILQELEPPDRRTAGGRVVAGGAMINVQPVVRFSVTQVDVNGKKMTVVRDNDKTINIQEDKNEISVSVTEVENGKSKTSQYKAADADELKKKHPEGFALYEKYAKGGNQAQIVVGNLGLANVPQVIPGGAAVEAGEARGRVHTKRVVAEARAELQECIKALKEAKDGKLDDKAVAELLKRIEAAEAKLKDVVEK